MEKTHTDFNNPGTLQVDPSCRDWNNIKKKFLPENLKPFSFTCCRYTDHVFLN